MTPASDGSVVDGSACRGIVMLAHGSPAWLDGLVAACVMAVSRMWGGAHYPHDVVAGVLVGILVALVALVLSESLRSRREAAACRLTATWLRPLLTPS